MEKKFTKQKTTENSKVRFKLDDRIPTKKNRVETIKENKNSLGPHVKKKSPFKIKTSNNKINRNEKSDKIKESNPNKEFINLSKLKLYDKNLMLEDRNVKFMLDRLLNIYVNHNLEQIINSDHRRYSKKKSLSFKDVNIDEENFYPIINKEVLEENQFKLENTKDSIEEIKEIEEIFDIPFEKNVEEKCNIQENIDNIKLRSNNPHLDKNTNQVFDKINNLNRNPDNTTNNNLLMNTGPFQKHNIANSLLALKHISNNFSEVKDSNKFLKNISKPLALKEEFIALKSNEPGAEQENNVIKENELSRKNKSLLNEKNLSDKISRELIKLPNVYDSYSEESVEHEENKFPRYILLPDSNYKQYWDIFVGFLSLYSIIISPYLLAFEDDSYYSTCLFYFDLIIDFIFLKDVVLNFFTAFRDEDDILIFSRIKISKKYLLGYFWIDIISSIPYSLAFQLLEANYNPSKLDYLNSKNLSYFKNLYRILKCTRFIRLIKVFHEGVNWHHKLFKRIGKIETSLQRLAIFLIFFIILTHLTSCIWCFLGKLEILNGIEGSWIVSSGIEESTNLEIYISSLYFNWGTIFTVGYGDIKATTYLERGYLVMFLTVGCMIFSFVISSLSSLFSQIDNKTELFIKNELLLTDMRKEYHIPKKLYDKIKKAIRFSYSNWNEDRNKLLESLPGSLKNKLYLKMHETDIKHLRFFEGQSYDFILYVVPLLKLANFHKDDILVSAGEIVEEMYLIITGIISVQLTSKYNNYEIGVLRTSHHLGDILMYINDQSNYDYKVKTKLLEVFILPKSYYAQIKLNFKNAINEILQKSYYFYEMIEKRRLAAIEHFNTFGNLSNFKNKYIHVMKRENEMEKNIKNSIFNKADNDLMNIHSNIKNLKKLGRSSLIDQIVNRPNLINNNFERDLKEEMEFDLKINLLKTTILNKTINLEKISNLAGTSKELTEDKIINLKPLKFDSSSYLNKVSFSKKDSKNNTINSLSASNLRDLNISNNSNNNVLSNPIDSINQNNKDKNSNFIYIKNLNINYSTNNSNGSDAICNRGTNLKQVKTKIPKLETIVSETMNNEISSVSSLKENSDHSNRASLMEENEISNSPDNLITKKLGNMLISNIDQFKDVNVSNNKKSYPNFNINNNNINSSKILKNDRLTKSKIVSKNSSNSINPYFGKNIQNFQSNLVGTKKTSILKKIEKKYIVNNLMSFPEKKELREDFLRKLNDKIENEGFLNQNRVVLEDYIKGFLDEKQGQSKLKDMLNKLTKIEKSIKDYVSKKNVIRLSKKSND